MSKRLWNTMKTDFHLFSPEPGKNQQFTKGSMLSEA
jgi:hypothetical protein